MAGATNRALKAAGIPKSTMDKVRVARGAGLTVQSAIQHAQAHGLPLGKAAKRATSSTGWEKAAAGATTSAEHRASHAAHEARVASEKRKAAMRSAMQKRQEGLSRALGAAGRGALATRKAARAAAIEAAKPKAPPMSALDRYRAEIKARMKADERESLTKMVGSVQRNARVGREALANSPKPRGGLERSVEHGILGGKTSVRNVKPIAKSGDFFVHKTGGLSSGYGVTHRPTGTMVYSSHSRSAAHAAMDGVAKTGSKVMARIEGGDIRAAKALRKYMGRLGSARFYNAAHAKYGKRAD